MSLNFGFRPITASVGQIDESTLILRNLSVILKGLGVSKELSWYPWRQYSVAHCSNDFVQYQHISVGQATLLLRSSKIQLLERFALSFDSHQNLV
jgi:hypothetical protein